MNDVGTELKRVGSTAQRLAEKPYEKRVCRIEAHYPPAAEPGKPVSISPEEYADIIADAGHEVIIVSGEHNRGTPRFPSRIFEPHPHLKDDVMPRFIELAHERGIVVLSYYPIIFSKPLRNVHPEWLMQFLDDGRPAPENEGWFCFNSPFRDWLPECLSDYMDNMDIDGFYFDDANWGSHGEPPHTPSCCCQYCEELFRAQTGFDVPRKVDFDAPGFRQFVNWRYEKLTEFLHHLFGSVRGQYPDAVLDLNTYYWPSSGWSRGHPLDSFRLEEVGGHFFVEAFPFGHRYLRTPGVIAKVLRSTGTPFSIFLNGSSMLKGFSSVPYPEPHGATVFGMVSLAHGGASCGAPFGGASTNGGYTFLTSDAHKHMFTELKKREEYLEGESLKYLALHYSTQNRDFQPSEIWHGAPTRESERQLCQKYAHGAYEMLNRSHIVLDFALDEHLTFEELSQYRVLFLSNSACLSDGQCDVIARFVKEGGTLIATHETSLLDEFGKERGQFGLADVLGVDYIGSRRQGDEHGVAYVPHDEELSRAFGYFICFYGGDVDVSVKSGTQVLCTRARSEGGEDPLLEFHPQREYDSGEPAVVVNTFGEGQSIYIAGDVGGAYMNSPYPPLMRFVVGLVKRTPPPLEIEAPEALEITAAHRPSGELMLHLINNPTPVIPWRIYSDEDAELHDDEIPTFHATTELVPLRDIHIRFNNLSAKSVRVPLQGIDLEMRDDAVVVPRVDLHEVLLVQVDT